MRNLTDLKRGESATVRDCSAVGAIRQRLCELGILPGAEVRLVGRSPLGDPLAIEIGEFQLALRRSEAALIEVECTP